MKRRILSKLLIVLLLMGAFTTILLSSAEASAVAPCCSDCANYNCEGECGGTNNPCYTQCIAAQLNCERHCVHCGGGEFCQTNSDCPELYCCWVEFHECYPC